MACFFVPSHTYLSGMVQNEVQRWASLAVAFSYIVTCLPISTHALNYVSKAAGLRNIPPVSHVVIISH